MTRVTDSDPDTKYYGSIYRFECPVCNNKFTEAEWDNCSVKVFKTYEDGYWEEFRVCSDQCAEEWED